MTTASNNPSAAPALASRKVLTLGAAAAMVQGCLDHAAETGMPPLSIAIMDAGGNLLAFARQERASIGSGDIAQLKAHSAAVLGASTAQLADIEYSELPRPLGLGAVPGLTTLRGGLAIRSADGQLLGGIGVSGASSEQDEGCAAAGIAAIASLLE